MTRKTLLCLVLSLVFICSLMAVTATTSQQISAYRYVMAAPSSYTITVTDLTTSNSEITGAGNVYNLSDALYANKEIDAFSITISSNLKASIPVTVVFSPFVNQNDPSKIVPVTYKYSLNPTPTYVQTANSTKESSNDYSYLYRYTPSVSFSPSTQLTVNETSSLDMEQSVSSISRTRSNKNNWSPYDSIPSDYSNPSSATLPGLSNTQFLETTTKFKLSITNAAYDAMSANVDYIATVQILVTAL